MNRKPFDQNDFVETDKFVDSVQFVERQTDEIYTYLQKHGFTIWNLFKIIAILKQDIPANDECERVVDNLVYYDRREDI